MAVDGRFLAGLDDDGVAREQGRRHLAGDQEEGEDPGQDARDHAQRLAQQKDLLVGPVAGDDLALDAARPFGHVVQIVGGEVHLDLCQAQDLALLLGDGARNARGVVADAGRHAAQVLRALHGRAARPGLVGAARGGDGAVHIGLAGQGRARQHRARGGVGHLMQFGAVGEAAGDEIAQHGRGCHGVLLGFSRCGMQGPPGPWLAWRDSAPDWPARPGAAG